MSNFENILIDPGILIGSICFALRAVLTIIFQFDCIALSTDFVNTFVFKFNCIFKSRVQISHFKMLLSLLSGAYTDIMGMVRNMQTKLYLVQAFDWKNSCNVKSMKILKIGCYRQTNGNGYSDVG